MAIDPAHLRPVRDHCLAPSRTIDAPAAGGRYGRLFPELAPLAIADDVLYALGGHDGACDGSSFAESGADDARGAAGWPLFAQFVAHDITADRSALTDHADLAALRNARSPRINLECVYGDGPVGNPYLYDRDDPARLLLGRNDAGRPDDVPRNPQGIALIGDPRNDVHLFVSQLHVAMLKLHNGLVDRLRQDGVGEADLFDEARRAATWHYQWVVLHDFLPRLVAADLAEALLGGDLRSYQPDGAAYIPLEFADAAYRYGHSQIRHAYRPNASAPATPLLPDLIGFGPVPAARVVDWGELFDLPGRPAAQRAKKIDGRLARSLIDLPVAITGDGVAVERHSLAVRDLLRGSGTALPSGEAVAHRLGVAPLSVEDVGLRAAGWDGETPLWFYVLKEAAALTDGEALGPVGGRIVGEVLVSIVNRDPESQRAVDPTWRPTLPAAKPGAFGLADLLRFARDAG